MVAVGCGGSDGDEGPAYQAAGNYTLTYERISRSDTCETRDLDWTNGILQITQSGRSITFDFGSDQRVDGSVDEIGNFSVSGTVDDNGDAVTLTAEGLIDDTSIAVDDDLTDQQMVGDYEFDADPEPDCRVRGRFTGPRIN